MFTPQQEADMAALRAETMKPSYLHTGWSARFERPVTLEVPVGELVGNWALALMFRVRKGEIKPITGKERFDAQGLEGKAVWSLRYGDALTHAQFIKPYRFRIVANGQGDQRENPQE